MATSEVFRPSDGDLLVRDFLSHGPTLSPEAVKKEEHRPQTQGGYRFGRLSHNSFFTRHNPHPTRVKHLKGLLDVPICMVNDDGYFSNPRYSLQFPPNGFDNQKLASWKGRIPVNRVVPPANPFVTFQQFSGLNGYPFREKAIPKIGLVPVTESWRDELAAFTRGLGLDDSNGFKDPAPSKPMDETRPRSTVYSPETGRIIPPPSRAVSRGHSRKGYMNHQFIGGNFQHISAHPEWENLVLMMLCQILQTDDVNAVQAWLCSAGEREKGMVMNLVKNALSSEDDYYKQYPAEFITDAGKTKLPPINEKFGSSNGEINRLVLDDGNRYNAQTEVKTFQNTDVQTEDTKEFFAGGEINNQQATQISDDEEDTIHPPINDVLKSVSNPVRTTLTPLHTDMLATDSKQEKTKLPRTSFSKSKKKHSKSSFKDKIDSMWSQNQSVNTF